jgi:hypothetical protein
MIGRAAESISVLNKNRAAENGRIDPSSWLFMIGFLLISAVLMFLCPAIEVDDSGSPKSQMRRRGKRTVAAEPDI